MYGKKRSILAGFWSADVRVVAGVGCTVHDTVLLSALVSKGGGLMATDNIRMEVQGHTLVITVDLRRTYGSSASGKSVTIASTGGNIAVPGRDEVKIGLNIYRPQKR
jgi:hypothetical protein